MMLPRIALLACLICAAAATGAGGAPRGARRSGGATRHRRALTDEVLDVNYLHCNVTGESWCC